VDVDATDLQYAELKPLTLLSTLRAPREQRRSRTSWR